MTFLHCRGNLFKESASSFLKLTLKKLRGKKLLAALKFEALERQIEVVPNNCSKRVCLMNHVTLSG